MLIDCPNCGRKMYLSARHDESECLHCQHIVTAPSQYLPSRDQLPQAHFQALQQLRRARLARKQNYRQQEIRALKQALHYDPRLVTVHIRLGRILPDVRERRRHLMSARRLEPDNMEAITLLARLQGSLTPEEAFKLFGDEAPVKEAASVSTETVELQCPVCRGPLHSHPHDEMLECSFCGYSERYEDELVTQRSVREGMVENIGKTRWEIGERVTLCRNCHAQWAHATRITTECPYCNSVQIVSSDAVGSFQQPDGLIPFELSEAQALAAIEERLRRFDERLKGIFNPNTIKRAVLNAVYLPFWVFDEAINIQLQTEFDVVAFKHEDFDPRVQQPGSTYDLGLAAVKSIPSQMTQQLGRYYRHTMVAYAPGVLDYPAEIYEIDLNRAVLRARAVLAQAIGSKTAVQNHELYSSDFSHTGYQLILVPVWLATLYEVDGDIRPVLVNGQMGKVVLGRANHPQ